LNLRYNTNITDSGLKYISRVTNLDLCYSNVTNAGLIHLPFVKYFMGMQIG
jgi:hypothetical protein